MIGTWWRLIPLTVFVAAISGCGGCQQSSPPAEKPAAGSAAGSSTGGNAPARPVGGGTNADEIPTARALPTIAEGAKAEPGSASAPGAEEEVPEEEPEAEADCSVIADAEPDFGPPPLTVHFSVDFECSDGSGTVQWTFGDGTSSSDSTPTHTYTVAGEYTAVARVTAADGLSATDEIDISVDAEAEPLDED